MAEVAGTLSMSDFDGMVDMPETKLTGLTAGRYIIQITSPIEWIVKEGTTDVSIFQSEKKTDFFWANYSFKYNLLRQHNQARNKSITEDLLNMYSPRLMEPVHVKTDGRMILEFMDISESARSFLHHLRVQSKFYPDCKGTLPELVGKYFVIQVTEKDGNTNWNPVTNVNVTRKMLEEAGILDPQ